MPGTPAGQPFAADWLLSCEQRSLPCHVGCMHFPSSRMPGNHVHGNGLPAKFVTGRRNVYEGYWAADESLKKSLAPLLGQ